MLDLQANCYWRAARWLCAWRFRLRTTGGGRRTVSGGQRAADDGRLAAAPGDAAGLAFERCGMTQARANEGYRPGYPIYLDLSGRKVVVIGAGAVAWRKVQKLLEYGAQVTVISPQAHPAIAQRAQEGQVAWVRRAYQPGDLADATICFCACGDPRVDRRVCEDAHTNGCLVNVVDVPQLCDFTVPAVVRRGLLTIAVSTAGASCAQASAIRRDLESEFDDSWEAYMDLLAQVRTLVKQRVTEGPAQRRPIFQACVQLGWRQRLASGEHITAEAAYAEAVAAARRSK